MRANDLEPRSYNLAWPHEHVLGDNVNIIVTTEEFFGEFLRENGLSTEEKV